MNWKMLFLIFLLPMFNSLNAQTYNFSKLVKKVSIEKSSGENEIRILNTIQGGFRIVFETLSDPKTKNLFTVLEPGEVDRPGHPWFGHLKDDGYVEINSKLFKKILYSDTENDSRVMVLIANDNSGFVIFKSDGTIWEYIK